MERKSTYALVTPPTAPLLSIYVAIARSSARGGKRPFWGQKSLAYAAVATLRSFYGHPRYLHILTKARAKPHVLDDATVDRIERLHREQLAFVDIDAERIRRWRTQRASAAQTRELDPGRAEPPPARGAATTDVLALAQELRKGTIDRIVAMSDLEGRAAAVLDMQPPPCRFKGGAR